MVTPDSIPNMRSDIFGLDFTCGDSVFYEYVQHEIRYIWFGFTRGESMFYEYSQHEVRYIWFGFYLCKLLSLGVFSP